MKSRVHKILLPLLSSLLLLLVIMPGCAAVTPVPTAPRDLDAGEKARLMELALASDLIMRHLDQGEAYTTQFRWIALLETPSVSGFWQFTEDWRQDPNYSSGNVAAAANYYPAVSFKFEGTQEWQVLVAVDLDRGAVVHHSESPVAKGPRGAVPLADSEQLARDFVTQSPTFAYDGIPDSLKLAKTLEISLPYAWTFEFTFDSAQAGYGDRTGRDVAQVITSHLARVTVDQGSISHAALDNRWDVLAQMELTSPLKPEQVAGTTPDFVGWVTRVEALSDDRAVGRVLVESHADKVVRPIWVSVNRETEIYLETDAAGNTAEFSAI